MSIALENLVKRYGGHMVVNRVSLEVPDRELFVLLGPSGSGKSTVLRMIAGLADVDEGRVLLHDRDVTALPPQKRDVGFVFQHYALFRHMTVARNIEFPLRVRRVKAAERARRRDELLELVGLAGLGGRLPDQLSGGQRQRVALARALAHKPEVLLLDEPFGALDAKIRSELRRTIRAIQKELHVTTIFVTHDQDEAFELADRIGVMDFGRLLEVGTPQELYLRPRTEFVASFVGTANLMVGEVTGGAIHLGQIRFPLGTKHAGTDEKRRVQVLFRPEDVAVKDSGEALAWPLLGRAVVEEVGFSGSIERLRLRLPPLAGVRPISPPAPYGGEFVLLEAVRSQHQARRFPLHPGDDAWVGVRRLHALTHPGLGVLLLTDGSPAADAAMEFGGRIARLAHARVTVLAHDLDEAAGQEVLRRAREKLGAVAANVESHVASDGLAFAVESEAARRSLELVVVALPSPRGRIERLRSLLAAGEHHLLLVPPPGAEPAPTPSRVLVCVAVGEPGKEDVQFAGRLLRHLGAEATILTVLHAEAGPSERAQAERFLAAGQRTLGVFGVRSRAAVRAGEPVEEIEREAEEFAAELLVIGAPLRNRRGEISLDGLVGDLVRNSSKRPLLIVRSHADARPRWAL